MSDTESDDDLRRAIALSLESNAMEIVDLVSSDSDGEDLKTPNTAKPTALQKVANDSQPVPLDAFDTRKLITQHETTSSTRTMLSNNDKRPIPAGVTGSLLGLNRKQMEQERLSRAQQRKESFGNGEDSKKRKLAGPSPYPNEENTRIVRPRHLTTLAVGDNRSLYQTPDRSSTETDNDIGTPLNKSKDTMAPVLGTEHSQGMKKQDICETIPKADEGVLSYKESQNFGSSGIIFPDGVVKKTWAHGYPREDDIKIEEVFQKDDLDLAVLSAFQVEPEWVASKLNQRTKVIWVLQAKTDEEKQNMRFGAPPNYQFCFPSMEGNINCMHSKLQLLAHKTHLRICIPSANLVPYDWGETGIMENMCFLIDLPRLPEGKTMDHDQITEFGRELIYYLSAIGLKESIIQSVKKFDFARTTHLAFIHTIGGSHSGKDWQRTGYCGLGTAVQKLGLGIDKDVSVDFVSASIGNINENFLKSMYLATQGDNGLKEYEWRTNKSSKSKVETRDERKLSDRLETHFRIYFPTRETVAQSKGGIGAGGTIYLQSRWFDSENFPRHIMRDCKSQRHGMLMHNKIIFVCPASDPSWRDKAWAYIGSANCSEAAWGRLVKDKISKGPKLNCRNWECGVLISVGSRKVSGARRDIIAREDTLDLSTTGPFRGIIPVPMVVPAAEYGQNRPWFMGEQ